jgi:hypothetical protein
VDILTAIDAATESLCACGCGQQLDPDGPSAWFAGQDCQRRWGDAQSTKPHEIYTRPEPHWSDAELDAMGAPPRRRGEQYTAIVEMVREARQWLPPRQRRTPVLDQPRDGFVVYPFIGGHWDGDLRAFRRVDAYALNVPAADPVVGFWHADDVVPLDYQVYSKRRIWMNLPHLPPIVPRPWSGHGWVFVHGEASDEDLQRALEWALENGWQPWLYSG